MHCTCPLSKVKRSSQLDTRMSFSGHSDSYGKTPMTQLLATASIRCSSWPSVALHPLDVLAGHASEDFECGTIKSRL